MSAFFTSITNKIDAKGRISVPARFRAALEAENFFGIWCFASFVSASIEGYSASGMEKFAEKIRGLDKYSEEREAFEHAVLGSAHDLAFDGEGRIMLPEQLMQHAGITSAATFVGLGDHFEIWEPAAYEAKAVRARSLAAEKRLLLDGRVTSTHGGAK